MAWSTDISGLIWPRRWLVFTDTAVLSDRNTHNNAYYIEGNGTAWALMSEGSLHYDVIAEELALSESSLRQALDQEKILILSMGPGQFSSSGHYIVIYDYNENGFYVNDPNSYSRSNKVWEYDEISREVRNVWAFDNI